MVALVTARLIRRFTNYELGKDVGRRRRSDPSPYTDASAERIAERGPYSYGN